mmetsp:Transcript_44442/g.71182  ORF Transcript_44442/g.71182 Transcript_44442/m.71182 type:complete len:214 (-) Transcript_44442:7-648(-)|eukprot:CAMPEP_0197033640 /NCGR_PEP_ID=MMETSP1384-20130603/11998_1 /TAXON_ID=29189 /ORGANISM="Ammonia sp." /LENGTH=213 /DNA_ID=CAMNT_0042463481 /DNA_START=83 /DNA_END=724 /DNA_ORIENTATION=-
MARKSSGDDYDFLLKMVLVGDSGVGKSCLLKRFASNDWDPKFISTIGVDFEILTLTLLDKQIRLQIWDTAGQERFHNITTSYYRGAHCIMIVYDVTSQDSFHNVRKWIDAVRTYANQDVAICIVGNKCDLKNKREIQWDSALQYAQSIGCELIETSAKTNVNVEKSFKQLASNGVKVVLNKKEQDKKTAIKLEQHANKEQNEPSSTAYCCGFL